MELETVFGEEAKPEMENSSLTNGRPKMFDETRTRDPGCCVRCLGKLRRGLVDNLLLVSTIVGVILGFVVGFAVRETHPSDNALMWLGLPGQLYLRLLKMMIVPLIACSVVCGAADLDPKSNGKISLIALIFAVSTNALGSALGVGTAWILNPGKDEAAENSTSLEGNMQTQDILADLIRNIIPDNLFEATFSQTQTQYKVKEVIQELNTTEGLVNTTVRQTSSYLGKIGNPNIIVIGVSGLNYKSVIKSVFIYLRIVVNNTSAAYNAMTTTEGLVNTTVRQTSSYLGKMGNPNIIGLIFACTLLGLAASSLKQKGRLFLELVQSMSDTVITVIRWFMWTTPIGVISLISVSIADIDDVQGVFAQLGLFILTVTIGIVIQQLIIMPAIFFVFTRKNPYAYLISIMRPWMIAFATTSTAVAIPEMLTACEEKNNIDKRVSSFVVPFSVTISANGAAVYIAAATIFIANLTGSVLAVSDMLLIWLLVTISVMAVPSVPSASILTTMMVLSSLNIPMEDIALLLAVEWYLDRIRSTSSVVSHTFNAAVTYSLSKKTLADLDHKAMRRHDTGVTIMLDKSKDSLGDKFEVKTENP